MIKTHKNQAFTLLEVLIATSVIMIGVFGIAGALALGGAIVKQAFRNDMIANGGQASLHTILASRFVEENADNAPVFDFPDDDELDIGRDQLRMVRERIDDEPPQYEMATRGDYTWVRTLAKIKNASGGDNASYYEVSAAVAYKTVYDEKDLTHPVSLDENLLNVERHDWDSDDQGSEGTLSFELIYNDNWEYVTNGDYVFLCQSSEKEAHWYKIENLYVENSRVYILAHGPSFHNNKSPDRLKTIVGIKGVFSRIVPNHE